MRRRLCLWCARVMPDMIDLAHRRRLFGFCTLAADVEHVRLTDGDVIEGRWTGFARRFPRFNEPRTVAVVSKLLGELANWPSDPEMIRQFTLRHGPLTLKADRDKKFSFSINEWRDGQRQFRQEWEDLRIKRGVRAAILPNATLEAEVGEQFDVTYDQLSYVANTLFRLLLLELQSVPRNRLRKCALTDCVNPYFVATHLRQRYCSAECAAKAQRVAKLKWWHKEGDGTRRRLTRQKKRRPGRVG
jgi:hypothetical protein